MLDAFSGTGNPNRGVGLVCGHFAIGTAERVAASLAQEFLFGKFVRRGGHAN